MKVCIDQLSPGTEADTKDRIAFDAKAGISKGVNIMGQVKSVIHKFAARTVLLVGATTLLATSTFVPRLHAQITISINPPVCSYGYYDYAPYGCAPSGFYGPGYFYNGIFLGVGPWASWGYNHGWGDHRFGGGGGGRYVAGRRNGGNGVHAENRGRGPSVVHANRSSGSRGAAAAHSRSSQGAASHRTATHAEASHAEASHAGTPHASHAAAVHSGPSHGGDEHH